MQRSARWFLAGQWLLVAGMLLMAAITWPILPDSLPAHWNLAGEVDRYGSKPEALLTLPLIALALVVLLRVLPRLDPFRARYAEFAVAYALIGFAIVAFLATIYSVMLVAAAGTPVSMRLVIGPLVGVLLIVIGAVLPQVRRNWFIGIRTPWTLSSELSWTATHRAARWMFVLMGVSIAVFGLVEAPWTPYLAGAVCVAGLLGLVVYSYVVWRRDPAVR